MNFFQYKNLRAFAMEPLAKHTGVGSVYRTYLHLHSAIILLRNDEKFALHLHGYLDLSPRETAATHLLAAVTNHRTAAWCYEQNAPDDWPPLPPFTAEKEKELCDQTLEAASAYAAFLPEREAAALLALVPVAAAPPSLLKKSAMLATPVGTETPKERRARWLAMLEVEEKREKRGALQRLADSEGVDRSNMGKDIQKARELRDKQKQAGASFGSQLVRDGKRAN